MSDNQNILFRQRPLNGQTVTVGTLGYPVHHTISPEFQGAAYEASGVNMVYLPFNVKPENIGDAVRGIRALGIRGTNVTMPHKQTAMAYMDELDPLAEAIGSINGIINTDGVLKGYNFDVGGFMIPFENMDLTNKKVVMLGAGGGARAASFGLAARGVSMVILNRKVKDAEDLAVDLINYSHNPNIRGDSFSADVIEREMAQADILVNCTSIGFDKQEGETPVPKELIRPGMLVYDIVYSPLITRLQREAAEQGAVAIGGLEMIVGQGAQFFEKATGKKAPYELMLETGRKVLLARQENEQ